MSKPVERLDWVDNIRTAMIVLVVNMHACVTYSHVGGWYTKEGPEPPAAVQIPYLLWQGHLQSFFMGLLFFFAGYFAHLSCTKRGPVKFMQDRLIRLGVPALVYMFLIHPFIVYVQLGHPKIPDRPPLVQLYIDYITSGRVWAGNGPLWFAIALLVFSGVLAAVRAMRPVTKDDHSKVAAPSARSVVGFGVVLVVATFLMRTVQPLESSILNFQLCFFPQYIAAFIVGIAAARQGWLGQLASSSVARRAGWFGLIGGPVMLISLLLVSGVTKTGNFIPFRGGWNLQAAGLAFWEQTAGLGLGLGVMSYAARKANLTPGWARWLSDRSFGVYVFHAPILVALTQLMEPWQAGRLLKILVLTVLGLVASYLVADLIRRIPKCNRVF